MANLKDLKNRIKSVKSTAKITKAMKMVAASKLRRAQERAEAARPFTEKMERMIVTLAGNVNTESASPLLVGRFDENGAPVVNKHLYIVVSSDRGLCGGFNSSVAKATMVRFREQPDAGLAYTVGKKARDLLRYTMSQSLLEHYDAGAMRQLNYSDAEAIAKFALEQFESGKVDAVSIVYNKFINAITQKVTVQQLIPLDMSSLQENTAPVAAADVQYEYEPGEDEILSDLLPRNVAIQVFHALLESAASEQGARMTAMDNASRNANDMIKALTLQYNRTRQAAITTELTEIIAGAQSV